MKKLCLILCILGITLALPAFSQEHMITGRITSSADGLPLSGVSVKIKGRSSGISTDATGSFSLPVTPGQILVLSHIGFTSREVSIDGQTTLQISLTSTARTLNDVVVVGYGTQKKADLTGAVSTVDVTKTLGARPITDLGRGLQGAVPGLTITTPSGELGKNPSIRLRGITGSLNSPSGAQPLILVDNVEIQSLQMINPEDIATISVLKDAASTSIYGTRAAWGVVLITTKSGKKGAPARLTYTNNFAFSRPTTVPKIASAEDGANMVLSALQRSSNNANLKDFQVLGMSFDSTGIRKIHDWQQTYGGQDLGPEMVMGRDLEIRNGKLYFYRPWDPMKMYMKDWSTQQKHDISLTGGSDKTSYNLGMGYMGQNGVLKVNPDEFNRYNATLGINTTVNPWLDLRSKFMVSSTLLTTPFIFGSDALDPWYYLLRWPAVYPYGTLDGNPFRSTLTEVKQARMNQDRNTFTRVQLGGTAHPIEGLAINFDYTYSGNNNTVRKVGGGASGIDFWSGLLTYSANYQSPSYDYVQYNSSWYQQHTGKLFATYDHRTGVHSFKVLAGSDLDYYTTGSQMSQRRNVIDPSMGEISLATGDQYVGGSRSSWATLGYFGRINYDYKNKILLEINGRYDGSSKFPTKDQWAFFPSASAGYVLTQEHFMDPLKDYLSFLKVRGSWGYIGNQAVGDWRFLSLLASSSSNWWIGNNNMVTFTTPQEVANSLTWEKVGTIDFGIDARLFRDQLGITFDWYRRTTSDMITPGITLPSSYGGTSPTRNYGEMQTTGWELAIDYSKSFGNGINFSATALLSDFQEALTRYANTTMGINSNYSGKKLGEIWGYETDRIFQQSDFTGQDASGRWIPKAGIADQALLENNSNWFRFGPGDIKYKDLNGDGKITPGTSTVDNPGDMRRIGNSTPRYQYGLRLAADYKGFDISMFWQGVGKRELWPLGGGPVFIPGFTVAEAWYQHQTDYWTPANPGAYYPRPTDHGQNASVFNFNRQTRYLLNMAYLRLKNIQLGYTIPPRLTRKARINSLRLYVSGENLLTFDKLKVPIDPEVDYTPAQYANAGDAFGRVYPYRKTISFGIQLGL